MDEASSLPASVFARRRAHSFHPPPSSAFTRYCFTPKLYCGSLSSFYCPPPLAKPTLLQYHCTTIAQYTRPSPTPLLYATHHTISVMAISCKGCLCVFCVGSLCGPPLRWWVLCGALPSVWVPCAGPLCGSPVWVPSVWVPRRTAFHVAPTRVMSPARSHAPA